MFLLAGTVSAQVTTATFYGIVTDPTGAVVPGANVTLTHEGTSAAAARTADAAGEFVFDFLRVGSYTLRIEARGFKKYESKGIP
ncbi:MAG: carboxypeptidase-like regulatory domain-containing protein, partial [Bryobacteraceae bacterium]